MINIQNMEKDLRREHYKHAYEDIGVFSSAFPDASNNFVHKDLGSESQQIREQVIRILRDKNIVSSNFKDLEEIHNHISSELREYNFDDGVNKLSTYLYDTDDEFHASYLNLIRKIRDYFPERPFYFQKTPTIRIHCPNAKNANHYPRYHTDVNYGHPPEEINLWIPLTNRRKSHGFRLMNLEASKRIIQGCNFDFDLLIDNAVNDQLFTEQCDSVAPEVSTEFGEALIFDSRCIHSGVPMLDHSRSSIDIRIIFLDDFQKQKVRYQGVGRRKILYTPGEAYSIKTSYEI